VPFVTSTGASGVYTSWSAQAVSWSPENPMPGIKYAIGWGVSQGSIDPETGLPLGLSLDIIPGFTMLMRDNKDRMVFARMSGTPKS
jgi:hypothetical protein